MSYDRCRQAPRWAASLALSLTTVVLACAEPPNRLPPPAEQVSAASGGAGAVVYGRTCDASAGVMLDSRTFVMADDETNTLRVYDVAGGDPIGSLRLDEGLGVARSRNPETDIEGAADAGDLVYWITSHGRNRTGRWRGSRYRLFATRLSDGQLGDGRLGGGQLGGGRGLELAGTATDGLVDALLEVGGADVAASIGRIGVDEARRLEPKAAGLNIEALAFDPAGDRLLIGLRNPLSAGRAIVFALANPKRAVLDGEPLEIGEPILIDLGGYGVRAMEYAPSRDSFLIVAGSSGPGGRSRLYDWTGDPDDERPRLLMAALENNPEALLVEPDSNRIGLLSDDGTRPHAVGRAQCTQGYFANHCPCKALAHDGDKSFRGIWIDPPLP